LLLTFAMLAAGCGQRVLLGGSEPGENPACEKDACGKPCVIEACEHVTKCDTPDVMGFCAADGSCVPMAPECPHPPPCKDQPCGKPCDDACGPDDPDCMMDGAHACDGHGACVVGPLMCPCMGLGCPPFDPCLGKPCGALCNVCGPGDSMCMEPPGPKSCDDSGTCVAGFTACGP
jgi:hypothetical protein